MYKLFAFDHDTHRFELWGSSWSGEERLLIDGQERARRRSLGFSGEYAIEVEGMGPLVLKFRIEALTGQVHVELRRGNETLKSDTFPMGQPGWLARLQQPGASSEASPSHAEGTEGRADVGHEGPRRAGGHWAAWLGIATKLLQSGKVVKAALAGMAVSGWTVMFSLPFALTLVAVLVFHEWGHLRAMRRFGIPTKGMYLIPFVGGVAVGERPQTRWQEVYIAMMGPVYGLGMTLVCGLAYALTSSPFLGLVASVSALINVFNLLPIHPLDGGRVVKALVFSSRSRAAFWVLLLASAACFFIATGSGMYLLSFFVVIGLLDLLASWKQRAQDTKPRLDRYGILFSAAWYLGTIAVFVAVIRVIASHGLPGSELAVKILAS